MDATRYQIPILVRVRFILKSCLGNFNKTSRGVSQSEAYTTLVVVEKLVNAGDFTKTERADLARQLEAFVGELQDDLTLPDIRRIRSIVAPFVKSGRHNSRANSTVPTVYTDDASEDTLPFLPAIEPAESNTHGNLPRGQYSDDERTGQAESRASTQRPIMAAKSSRAPARRCRNFQKAVPSEWGAVQMLKAAEDDRVTEQEAMQKQNQAKIYNQTLQRHQGLVKQRRQHEKAVDDDFAEQLLRRIEAEKIEEEEKTRRKQQDAARLNELQKQLLEEREQMRREEDEKLQNENERRLVIAKGELKKDLKKQQDKKANAREYNRKMQTVNARNKVLQEEEQQKLHQDERRIAKEAIEMQEQRDSEREAFLQNQQARISKMVALGGDAVKQTDQRAIDDQRRADVWAQHYENEQTQAQQRKQAKQRSARQDIRRTLEQQMQDKREAERHRRQQDKEYAKLLTEEVSHKEQTETSKQQQRRAQAQELQTVLKEQMRAKNFSFEDAANGDGVPLVRDMDEHERVLNHTLLRQAKEVAKNPRKIPEPPKAKKPIQRRSPRLALGGDIRKILTLVAEKAEQKSRNIRVVFRNFDEDKSGTLNYKEFRQGLIGLGIVLSDSDFDALVKVLDNDGNGEINYGEFVEDMKAVDQQVGGFFGDPGRHKKKMDDYKENQRVAEVHNAHAAGAGRTGAEILATVKRKCEEKSKQIRKIFRTFDENHDGKVTYAEFRQGLRGLGFQLPDADFNALVKHVDDDGSGALDYNEFVAELHLHEPQTGGQIGGSGTHKKRMAELAAKQNENEHDWSVADVAATLASIKQKCEQKSKHIRKVFRAFDSDKNGTLSVAEFRRGALPSSATDQRVGHVSPGWTVSPCWAVKCTTRTAVGVLRLRGWPRAGLNNMGIRLNDADLGVLLSVVDQDRSGTVDYREFVAKFCPLELQEVNHRGSKFTGVTRHEVVLKKPKQAATAEQRRRNVDRFLRKSQRN